MSLSKNSKFKKNMFRISTWFRKTKEKKTIYDYITVDDNYETISPEESLKVWGMTSRWVQSEGIPE